MKVTSIITVEARGIGVRDYSSGIEFSVEPTIRSYQEVYSNWQVVSVPAGADLVTNIAIPSGYVAIVYDFFASIPLPTLLGLTVAAVSGALIANVLTKRDYGTVVEHLSKGFPFFETMRFTIHNFHSVALDVNIGAVGIYTDEEHYYLRRGVAP